MRNRLALLFWAASLVPTADASGSASFQLQSAMGLEILGPVLLPESSATVQNLVRTNRPATGGRIEEVCYSWRSNSGIQACSGSLRSAARMAIPTSPL
jgi:hypothetical protein